MQSDAFENQCNNPATYDGLPFEDRFGMLVDKEWDKNNRCIKWKNYEITCHQLVEADELYRGN